MNRKGIQGIMFWQRVSKGVLALLASVFCIPFVIANEEFDMRFLVVGDTQKVLDPKHKSQQNFVKMISLIKSDKEVAGSSFVLQMGDVVESDKDNSDRPQQYEVAKQAWGQLDGKLPYVLNFGNNDDEKEYNQTFPVTTLHKQKGFHANHEGSLNTAFALTGGGQNWFVISIQFDAKKGVYKWAEKLIEEHSKSNVIIISHNGEMKGPETKLADKYPQVKFVLSGHTKCKSKLMEGDSGKKYGWIRTCFHDPELDLYCRVVDISLNKGTVRSRFYSPFYKVYLDDPKGPHYKDKKNPRFSNPHTSKDKSDRYEWKGFEFVK